MQGGKARWEQARHVTDVNRPEVEVGLCVIRSETKASWVLHQGEESGLNVEEEEREERKHGKAGKKLSASAPAYTCARIMRDPLINTHTHP